MENLSALDDAIRNRAHTDRRIDFVRAFLLSLVTFGIYGVYVLYRLLERREQHFERMVSLRRRLRLLLEERAATVGGLEADVTELKALDTAATERDRRGEKTPVLWLVLGILTGVTNFYVFYFLNDDFRAHAEAECAFFEKASAILKKLGRPWPAPAIAPLPERRFVKYLFLTLVSLGIFGVYWWYTLITDPDSHFAEHAAWETGLREALARS